MASTIKGGNDGGKDQKREGGKIGMQGKKKDRGG